MKTILLPTLAMLLGLGCNKPDESQRQSVSTSFRFQECESFKFNKNFDATIYTDTHTGVKYMWVDGYGGPTMVRLWDK